MFLIPIAKELLEVLDWIVTSFVDTVTILAPVFEEIYTFFAEIVEGIIILWEDLF